MKHDDSHKLVFFTLIAGRKQKKALLTALSKTGLKLTNIIYGKGTVKASYLKNLLGLIAEENKSVITGLIARDKSEAVFDMLIRDFHFDKPNTGIAFTIPIERFRYK